MIFLNSHDSFHKVSRRITVILLLLVSGVSNADYTAGNRDARTAGDGAATGENTSTANSENELSEDTLPLSSDETIEFTTEQVTWLSLDIAPNGQQMVIEVLGNLYTLPIEGGLAKPLTSGMAFDSQPKYSPDGRQIVFISDRSGSEELWLLELATNTTKRLSKSTDRTEFASPIWSNDGQHILVSKTTFELRTFELWAYPLNGGDKGVQITKANTQPNTPRNNRHNALGPSYGGEGRYVYFAGKKGGFTYNAQLPLWQIVRRDLRTGIEDTISRISGSAMRPVVSPDGKSLVYATRYEHQTGLRIRDLASGDEQWLAYPVQRDEQESRFTRDLLPGYSFTPDSKHLFFTRDGGIAKVDITTKHVTQIPFSVDVALQVAPRLNFPWKVQEGPVQARILSDAQLSPDASKLAFAAFNRIYVYDLAGKEAEAISPKNLIAADPSWSPNGRDVVYTTWQNSGGQIYRQRARAGAKVKQLTEIGAYYLQPVFSPDAKRIVALRGSTSARLSQYGGFGVPAGASLVWMDAGGGPAQTIIPARELSRPHFGPQPERIYLQANSSAIPAKSASGLVSIRFDGTDRQEHLNVSGPGIYHQKSEVGAQVMTISPNGKYVLFTHASQLYLTELLPHVANQSINLQSPNLPIKKLTDVGANFFGWADSEQLFWTVGDHLYQRKIGDIDFVKNEDVGAVKSEATPDTSAVNQDTQHAAGVEQETPSPAIRGRGGCPR